MTGCGQIVTMAGAPVLYNGKSIPKLTFAVGHLCCDAWTDEQIEVTAHPGTRKKDVTWQFDTASLACSKSGNPALSPKTADCANQFIGTALDGNGNTLTFTLTDNGEAGRAVDFVSLVVRSSGGATLLSGTGTLARGNLQVQQGLGPLQRDCSGC